MHLDRNFPISGHNIEVRIYFIRTNRYRAFLRYHAEKGKENLKFKKLPEVFRTSGVARNAAIAFARLHPNPSRLLASEVRHVSPCFVGLFEHRRLRRAERDLDPLDKFFMKGLRCGHWPHAELNERYSEPPSFAEILKEWDDGPVEEDEFTELVEG